MKNLTVEWICALWEQTKITRFLQFVEAGSQEKPKAQGISVKKKKKNQEQCPSQTLQRLFA